VPILNNVHHNRLVMGHYYSAVEALKLFLPSGFTFSNNKFENNWFEPAPMKLHVSSKFRYIINIIICSHEMGMQELLTSKQAFLVLQNCINLITYEQNVQTWFNICYCRPLNRRYRPDIYTVTSLELSHLQTYSTITYTPIQSERNTQHLLKM
jgi:hypothetical protein